MSTPQNDSFQIRAPKPIDSRYLKNETVPWVSPAEVNAAIIAPYRYIGLTVLIGSTEFWYIGGKLDEHLVPKRAGDIALPLSSDGFYTSPTPILVMAMIVTPTQNILFKAGSSTGAEDFVPEIALVANVPAVVSVQFLRNAAQTIHFSGIVGSTLVVLKTL